MYNSNFLFIHHIKAKKLLSKLYASDVTLKERKDFSLNRVVVQLILIYFHEQHSTSRERSCCSRFYITCALKSEERTRKVPMMAIIFLLYLSQFSLSLSKQQKIYRNNLKILWKSAFFYLKQPIRHLSQADVAENVFSLHSCHVKHPGNILRMRKFLSFYMPSTEFIDFLLIFSCKHIRFFLFTNATNKVLY